MSATMADAAVGSDLSAVALAAVAVVAADYRL